MAWIEISIAVAQKAAEQYADALSEAGALSVTFSDAKDDPLFEPEPGQIPLWQHTQVTGLFDATVDAIEIIKKLATQFGILPTQFAMKHLADQNWIHAWMDQFQPMQFGNTLWIYPNHYPIIDPHATVIRLDPGMAFGTGTHPTTRLCLEWLDANPPQNAIVLDYGCGSGILGIAALKLGATYVVAVDYDPQALDSTNQNALNNGLTPEQIRAILPTQLCLTTPVDVIIANILAGPLIELAPRFAQWIAPQGKVILSGILVDQVESLLECYELWFKKTAVVLQDGWARLDLTAS